MRDVFLLGAGFSKAISSEMPTLHELSEAVSLPRAEGSAPAENEADFEAALTILAEDQPWLTPADNLMNRARFLEASRDIAGNLASMQAKALGRPPPDWLLDLVKWWIAKGATVATTNYDVLVERAFTHVNIDVGLTHRSLYPVPISNALSRVTTIFGGEVIGPFKLLKLHGSLNWFYSGRESHFGEPIFDAAVPTGWDTDHDLVGDAAMAVSDKTRLVIPPTFGKSSFFQSETILTIWRNAWQAITDADRLICIGYSLPRSDLNMVHLLRGVSFRSGQVLVVNRDPSVLNQYRDLLQGIDVETFGDGPDVVPEFVSNPAD
jgi:hypothetical protein